MVRPYGNTSVAIDLADAIAMKPHNQMLP